MHKRVLLRVEGAALVRGEFPSSSSVAEILEKCSADYLKQAEEATPDLSASTKLYATSRVLLAATQEKRVVSALIEICSNLLACEELAIVEIKSQARAIHFLGAENLLSDQRTILTNNPGTVEKWITPGNPFFPRHVRPQASVHFPLSVSAVVPLWRDEYSSAAIVLLRLLPQRTEFDKEDRKVLNFLSLYAGPCLRSDLRERTVPAKPETTSLICE